MTYKIDGTNGVLQQYDYQVPTTGFSYTFGSGTNILMMNPAGTLATGTITMPASPVDGMTITISSTRQITALTIQGNTGQSLVSPVTFLPANQATTYVYRLSNTTWYPISTVATNVPVPSGGSIITSNTAIATTSGTSFDFTGIPSWVKRITVVLASVTPASSTMQVQLGTSSGIDSTSTYISSCGRQGLTTNDFTNSTTAFVIQGASSGQGSGNVIITTVGSNIWSYTSTISAGSSQTLSNGAGTKTLSGTLDRIRLSTATGSATFSAGSVNILYE